MKSIFSVLILTIIVLIFSLSRAMAATYYVSTQGDDSNNGLSEATPWRTINVNVNTTTFQPGDTILFHKGETWYDQLTISSSGTVENPIVYSSYGSAGVMPKIEGRDNGVRNFGNVTLRKLGGTVSNITIENLEITGKFAHGVLLFSTTNVTIRNCYIHDHGQVYEEDTEKVAGHCIAGNGPQLNTKILSNEIANCYLEAIMINSENIEIAYNHMHHVGMDQVMGHTPDWQGQAKADIIQLNCWSKNYWVHDNLLDRRGSIAPKGVFISSHCTGRPTPGTTELPQSCYKKDPRCTGESDALESNGIFENNECIAGEGNGFGFTNSGYGDIVRNNSFISHHDSEERLPLYGLRSENGALAYNNSWKGFKHAVETSKLGGRYHFYNNIFDLYESSQPYHVNRSGTSSDIQLFFRNNIFMDTFLTHGLNSNDHQIHLSNNIFIKGHETYNAIIQDGGQNKELELDFLKIKDWENNNGALLSNSPLINAGTIIDEQSGFANHAPVYTGSTPNIGLNTNNIGISPGITVGPVFDE